MLVISQIQKLISGVIDKSEQTITAFFSSAVDGSGTPRVPVVDSTGALRVNTIGSGGETQIDLVKVGGAGIKLGSWPSTSAMAVSVATDSTFINSAGELIVQVTNITSDPTTNITQIGGAGVVMGSWASTSSLSVVLATDKTLRSVDTTTIINNETINPGSSFTTSAVEIISQRAFSIEYDITTAGSKDISLTYTASNNGTNYYNPISDGGVIGSFTSDGFIGINAVIAKNFKVVCTNNDVADCAVNGYLCSDRL